jgi:hypothetical protein
LGRLEEYWRLRHFKGPATTGVSWWWHSKAVISGRSHEYYGDVTEKYGMLAITKKCTSVEVPIFDTTKDQSRG